MAPIDAKDNLILAMYDPKVAVYSDEHVVIIPDIYPKSKHHYLVLPKEDIKDARCLRTLHIPILIYMELKGLEYVVRKTGLPAHWFQSGYHSFPSMNRLHLHILSKDFSGDHMRLPYQWNSFHTEFFLSTNKVISELQTMGQVVLPPNKRCLNQPLKCHSCNYFSHDLNNMKLHLTIFHNVLSCKVLF